MRKYFLYNCIQILTYFYYNNYNTNTLYLSNNANFTKLQNLVNGRCLVITLLIIVFLYNNIINRNFPNDVDENSITINKTDGNACIMQQNFRHIPRNTWLILPAINHFPWRTLKYAGNCSHNDRTRRIQKTINVRIRGVLASRRGTNGQSCTCRDVGHWPMHSLHYYRTEWILFHLFESLFFLFRFFVDRINCYEVLFGRLLFEKCTLKEI